LKPPDVNKYVEGIAVCILFILASPCFSQIVINEVHVRPLPDTTGNPSEFMVSCMDSTAGAEWVEIYNASLCDTVDLACYMLGSRTADTNYGTFAFPPNARLAPLSFLVVGGPNAPNVDFKLSQYCFQQNLCESGEWSLDNNYGWVALYDPNGTVLDAVYWTASSGQAAQLASNSAYSREPCIPSCAANSLRAASAMAPGTEIKYAGKVPSAGQSLFRDYDGFGGWLTDGTPTPGACNNGCAPPSDLDAHITFRNDETCLLRNGWAVVEYSGGVAPYDVDWSNQSNADSVTGLVAGCYSVTVSDSLGCTRADSVCIQNVGMPVSLSITPPQSTIFKGDSQQLLLVTTSILDSIIWNPSSSLSCSDCASPIASPLTLTTYTVDVVDINGCAGSATATVAVVSDENSAFIPTAFTPNDDNSNDILYVRSPRLRTLDFRIYDRWGTEVFATTDVNEGWDGRDKNGNEVDVGIYAYYAIVTFDNGKSKTLKGNVAVLK